MPHALGSLVVAAAVADIVGLAFAAAVLFGLNRAFPRPHLRAWAWAWVTSGFVAAGGVVVAALPVPPAAHHGLTFTIVFLVYLHAAALLVGALALRRGDGFTARRLVGWGVATAALLGLAGLAGSTPGAARTLLRFALPSAAVTGAAIAAAAALWRRSGPGRATGPRIMAVAMGLYALLNAHHTVMYVALLVGAPFPGYTLYLGFASLALLTAFSLGSVVSLLEEERDLLALSEQKAAKLFRNSPDAIVVTLPFDGGRIVDVNERFEQATGIRREDAIGRTSVELGFFADGDAQRAFVADAAVNGVVHDREITYATKDGGRRTFSIAAETFEWQGATHAVAIARDITERLAFQEERRRARLMEALGSLVAGVAHEARNPLFAISALVEAMQAGDPRGRDFSTHAAELKSQVNRLSRLMQDLLDYGRPSELRRALTAIDAVARSAAASLSARAADRRVCVDVSCEEPLPRVDGDAARLEQVLENLIANAIQHAPSGSTVRVRVARDPERVPASLRCTVEDDGPGIPEEHLPRLFEPFCSGRPGGTGLGLPIVHRLVAAHGGAVAASTRPSGGACFTVWLPIPPAEAGSPPGRP